MACGMRTLCLHEATCMHACMGGRGAVGLHAVQCSAAARGVGGWVLTCELRCTCSWYALKAGSAACFSAHARPEMVWLWGPPCAERQAGGRAGEAQRELKPVGSCICIQLHAQILHADQQKSL